MKPLSPKASQAKLAKLGVEWSLPGDGALHRVFSFDDFVAALKFVNKVGKLAEKQNHHPDIHLSWGKVEIVIISHDLGALSSADFKLAMSIETAYQSGT